VVNWSGRPLQDQIRISHNATHLAGIIGTAFHNAIWSQNGTTFYAIRPNTKYLFDWEHDIVRSLENVTYRNVDPWNCKDYQEMYDFIYNSINDES
jgi:capsular polysaccharide biosynthesis protein